MSASKEIAWAPAVSNVEARLRNGSAIDEKGSWSDAQIGQNSDQGFIDRDQGILDGAM
jgi:hypothetical protein